MSVLGSESIFGFVSQPAQLLGIIDQGQMIVNDWVITAVHTENGGMLIARRGSEEQVLEIRNGDKGDPGTGIESVSIEEV